MANIRPAPTGDGFGDGWLLRWTFRRADMLRRLFVSSIRKWPDDTLSRRRRLRAVETEMVIWLLVLVGALLLSFFWSPLVWPFVVVGLIRWLNIVGYSLYSVLADASEAQTAFASTRRSVVMGLINVITLWALFAVTYRAVGALSFKLPPGNTVASVSEAAYLSWATLLTIGSDIIPTNWIGRILLMLELGTGLLVLGVTLSALIGALRIKSQDQLA